MWPSFSGAFYYDQTSHGRDSTARHCYIRKESYSFYLLYRSNEKDFNHLRVIFFKKK